MVQMSTFIMSCAHVATGTDTAFRVKTQRQVTMWKNIYLLQVYTCATPAKSGNCQATATEELTLAEKWRVAAGFIKGQATGIYTGAALICSDLHYCKISA